MPTFKPGERIICIAEEGRLERNSRYTYLCISPIDPEKIFLLESPDHHYPSRSFKGTGKIAAPQQYLLLGRDTFNNHVSRVFLNTQELNESMRHTPMSVFNITQVPFPLHDKPKVQDEPF